MKIRIPSRNLVLPLLLGLIIREALSFWTGHPFDFEVWLRNGFYVSQGANPYSRFPPVPGLSFEFIDRSIGSIGYLPAWSLLDAGIYRLYALLPFSNRFVLYFLLKQPAVMGDILLAVLLYQAVLRWGGTQNTAFRGLRYWSLFPYAVVISAVWGQFDALIALLWVAFLISGSAPRRSLLLGISIFLKIVPLLFTPYLLLRERRNSRGAIIGSLVVPACLTGLVFLVTGWHVEPLLGTLQNTVQGSVVFGMTYMNLFVDPTVLTAFSPFGLLYVALRLCWIPAVLVVGLQAYRLFPGRAPVDTVQASLLVLAVFLLTRWGVNEQLLIALFPLLLLDTLLWHPGRRQLSQSLGLVAGFFLIVNNALLFTFIGPVYPGVLAASSGFIQVWGLETIRRPVLEAVGLLFTILLIQLALVVANPRRDPTPWLVRGIRTVWRHSLSTRTRAEPEQ